MYKRMHAYSRMCARYPDATELLVWLSQPHIAVAHARVEQ